LPFLLNRRVVSQGRRYKVRSHSNDIILLTALLQLHITTTTTEPEKEYSCSLGAVVLFRQPLPSSPVFKNHNCRKGSFLDVVVLCRRHDVHFPPQRRETSIRLPTLIDARNMDDHSSASAVGYFLKGGDGGHVRCVSIATSLPTAL